MNSRLYALLAFVTTILPSVASAQSLGQLVGYFNILTGILLVVACLCFGSGFTVYIARFGLVGRELGIQQMSWGVTILFVLVILLWGVKFVQGNPKTAMTLVAVVVFLFIGRMVFAALAATKSDEKEH